MEGSRGRQRRMLRFERIDTFEKHSSPSGYTQIKKEFPPVRFGDDPQRVQFLPDLKRKEWYPFTGKRLGLPSRISFRPFFVAYPDHQVIPVARRFPGGIVTCLG